jgi:acyl carrier protein
LVVDYEETKKFLISQPSVRSAAVVVVDLPFKPTSLVAFIVLTEGPTNLWETGDTRIAEAYFHELCRKALHAYQAPECVYVLSSLPKKLSVVEDVAAVHRGVTSIDISALSALAQRLYSERTLTKPRNATEAQMELVWRQELGSASAVSVTASFFDLGGDSLKAGQLINAIRKRMNVHLAVTDLFTAPTIELLSHRVSMMQTLGVPSRDANDVRSKAVDKNGWSIYTDEYIPPPINTARASSFDEEVGVGFRDDDQSDSEPEYSNEKTTSPFASDSFSCLFVQALPLVLILPLRRVLVWLLVAALWVQTMRWGQSRLHALMIAIVLSRAITSVVAPLVGVAAKWLIIGRYKPGRYPLWGNMYLRYVCTQLCFVVFEGFSQCLSVYIVPVFALLCKQPHLDTSNPHCYYNHDTTYNTLC